MRYLVRLQFWLSLMRNMSKDFYNYKQGDNTKQKSFVIPTQNTPVSKLINLRCIAKYLNTLEIVMEKR